MIRETRGDSIPEPWGLSPKPLHESLIFGVFCSRGDDKEDPLNLVSSIAALITAQLPEFADEFIQFRTLQAPL